MMENEKKVDRAKRCCRFQRRQRRRRCYSPLQKFFHLGPMLKKTFSHRQ
jgi:hypothetical protein